jgi:muramidase (phage lysozyme)
MNKKLIAAAGFLGYGAYVLYRSEIDDLSAGDVMADQLSAAANAIDSGTWGMLRISNIRKANIGLLSNANIQAMLKVIRAGEGTLNSEGYSLLYGGERFSGYGDHPRITVKKGNYTSTAAGAYQFLESTWDETAQILGLPDFSPTSQDIAAIGRIAARGALADVIAGRFDIAIRKIAREWASMPGSPYGQPTIQLETARKIFVSSKGTLGNVV